MEKESAHNEAREYRDVYDEVPPEDGEIRIEKGSGQLYQWRADFTVREYFSHHTDRGFGPGWDMRSRLLEDDWALKNFGRTFTTGEVYGNTHELPDIPFYQWEPYYSEHEEK